VSDFQQQFKDFILNDIFWFDKSEINFGIYKIFRQKETLIKDNLDAIVANIHASLSQDNEEKLEALKNTLLDDYIPGKKARVLSLEAIEDIKAAIQEFGNGDTDKLLKQLNVLQTENKFDATKVYEYLYQFFHLYYEKGDFGYTPRSFRTYTIPYHHEEHLLDDGNKCSMQSATDAEYAGEETMFTWKTKDSYYIKSSKLLNSVVLSLDYKEQSYAIHTQVVEKDKTIKDDKKVKQYRLISIKNDDDNKITLRFNISDHPTPKHTVYALMLAVIQGDIVDVDYDVITQDKAVKDYLEALPFENPINESLLDTSVNEVTATFSKVMKNDELSKYLWKPKPTQKNPNAFETFFKYKLTGEEDKAQIKAKVSKLMLSKKDYATKIYSKATAKAALDIKAFDFDNKQQLEALYEDDATLNFFYRLDRGVNLFYAGVDSDYFIHKNLKRFLNVELDKFIKNYIFVDTDALLRMDESAQQVALFAKVFKEQAQIFIDMLASIEEFQKYLWNKRKMVRSSHYVISSNKIEDKALLKQTFDNKAQVDEWIELGLVDAKPSLDELKQASFPVDTKYFDIAFKYELLSQFKDIEEALSGLLLKSENYQALRLLEPKYHGKVKCIYIDPPYNTGNDGFVYKDSYKEASWLSMMQDRLKLAHDLMREDGVIFSSIDDNESTQLSLICDELFNKQNFMAEYTWVTDGNFDNTAKIKQIHEYVLMYAKNVDKYPHPPVIDPNTPKTSKLFKNEIQNTIVKNGPKNPLSKIELPMGFPASFESGIIKKRDNEWPHYLSEAEVIDYRLTKAVTVKSGWSSIELLRSFIDNSCQDIFDNKQQKTRFIISSTGSIEVIKVRNKHQSHVVSVLSNLGGPQKANSELSNLGIIFKDYPKPTQLIRYFEEMNEGRDFTTLDFFSGSGTTAHATMDANRKDDGQRKFIVAEMNDYFETIILPRVKKVNFASEWKEGKAKNRDGYGGIFQYIELEQYDDIIDKLQVVDDADYSKSESCYIYEPDKNQINFRMEKELIDPLSETAHFDLFHSLLFHHGLALVTVSLDDDVLFAQCLNKQGKTCAIVLSSDDDKAKAKVASLGSDYTEVFANVRTPGATRIVADLFKG